MVLKDVILVTEKGEVRERWALRKAKWKWGMKYMEHQDWLCNIINHHNKFHPSDDFLNISDTTLDSAFDSLWLTQPWGSIPLLIKSSHQIKSSFHFYLNFPMMSHCVLFYYSFYFWFIIWSSCCSEMELSGIFLWLIDEKSIAYRSQTCCLVVHDSPMYIKRLSCLRERQSSSRIYSQLSFTLQDLKLDSSDYNIRISHLFSSRSWALWLHHWSVSMSSSLLQHRFQRLRISFEKYIEYFFHYTNFEAVLVFSFGL